jgi:hypothetical protein
MSTFGITGLEEHEATLRAALFENSGVEGAAYVLFREVQIASDPWDRRRHTKLLVREVIPIMPVSADGVHVTWDTASYLALLQRAQREELVLGVAHSHPSGPDGFSGQDDANEAELLRTACNRNGAAAKLVSMLFAGDGTVLARVWQYPKHQTMVRSMMFIGERIQFHRPGAAPASAAFARPGSRLRSRLNSPVEKSARRGHRRGRHGQRNRAVAGAGRRGPDPDRGRRYC